MGFENNEQTTETKSTDRKHRPAHRKTGYAKIVIVAAAAVVLSTGFSAYALPMAGALMPTENPVVAAPEAAAPIDETVTVPEVPTNGNEAATETDSSYYVTSSNGTGTLLENNEVAATNQRKWHDAWTETISHPAEHSYVEPYDVYVCSECGYETYDIADANSHMHFYDEVPPKDYVIVTRGGYDEVVREAWTETVEHPGYWE